MKCPKCSIDGAYIGFTSVECSNPSCIFYVEQFQPSISSRTWDCKEIDIKTSSPPLSELAYGLGYRYHCIITVDNLNSNQVFKLMYSNATISLLYVKTNVATYKCQNVSIESSSVGNPYCIVEIVAKDVTLDLT